MVEPELNSNAWFAKERAKFIDVKRELLEYEEGKGNLEEIIKELEEKKKILKKKKKILKKN
jgi:hypothetical protein